MQIITSSVPFQNNCRCCALHACSCSIANNNKQPNNAHHNRNNNELGDAQAAAHGGHLGDARGAAGAAPQAADLPENVDVLGHRQVVEQRVVLRAVSVCSRRVCVCPRACVCACVCVRVCVADIIRASERVRGVSRRRFSGVCESE